MTTPAEAPQDLGNLIELIEGFGASYGLDFERLVDLTGAALAEILKKHFDVPRLGTEQVFIDHQLHDKKLGTMDVVIAVSRVIPEQVRRDKLPETEKAP